MREWFVSIPLCVALALTIWAYILLIRMERRLKKLLKGEVRSHNTGEVEKKCLQ